jgi:hypothetical protein
MTDSVVIEIPAETMDVAAIFTKSFFDKLGVKTDVVCVKCPSKTNEEEHSGQEGGERPKELTMPYRLFYNIFSIFSLPFSSNNPENEPNKVNNTVAEKPPKPPVLEEKPDTAESTVPGDTASFREFLKNTIVSNPTKVEKDAPSLYNMGEKAVVSIVKPALTLKPLSLSDIKMEDNYEPEKQEEKEESLKETVEPKDVQEPTETQESKKETVVTTVPLFNNQKEEIKEFVGVWEKSETGETPVLRIELFGKDIKRVESKTEYIHYMDEYLLKREIDIISNGRKKMVSTEHCEQYMVDGRYIILGPIEDKPQEDLKPEIQWNTIKNTEAYKKFVRYNII